MEIDTRKTVWTVKTNLKEGYDIIREIQGIGKFPHIKVKKVDNHLFIRVPENDGLDFLKCINGQASTSLLKASPALFEKKPRTPYRKMRAFIEQYLLKNQIWDKALLDDIPRHWEKHGDLIILPATAFTNRLWMQRPLDSSLWDIVAESLSCSRVAKRFKINSDDFRTPKIKLLKGENGWVKHVDNGVRYEFDVTKCMFSPGNITEKLRIAHMNCSGETVVDMYAGIGYFTLPFLVHSGAKLVHACEWNKDAVEALERNLTLNGVQEKCTIHFGDNRQVTPRNVANRVNLGLLPSSRCGWETACAALRQDVGGILHVHENITCHLGSKTLKSKSDFTTWGSNVATEITRILSSADGGCKWLVSVLRVECVKSYAPHVFHLVVDLECRPFC